MLVLEPSPLARRLLWHAFSINTACLDEPERHKPFEKPGAHLFWVESGSGTMDVQGRQYALGPGKSSWFVNMASPRVYTPQPGQQLVKRGFRLGGPALEGWFEELGGNLQAGYVLRKPSALHKAYPEIWQIGESRAPGWEWKIHRSLDRVLGLLLEARNLTQPGRVEIPLPVARVLNAIAARPGYDWKVKQLSALAGVSYSSLRALFRASQQENIKAYVQRCRLDRARILLADERLSMKQIAEQLRFSSEFYFSHFFHRLTGLSPTQYRASLNPRKKPSRPRS